MTAHLGERIRSSRGSPGGKAIALFCAATMAAPCAYGAKVLKVLTPRNVAILEVSGPEAEGLAVGQATSIRSSKESLAEATITGIEAGKLRLTIHFGLARLAEGDVVNVDASSLSARAACGDRKRDEPARLRKLSAHSYSHPFLHGGRLAASLLSHAPTHLRQFEEGGVVAYVRQEKGLATASAKDASQRRRDEYTAFGLTPVGVSSIKAIRLAVAYDAEEYTARWRLATDGQETLGVQRGWRLQSLSLLAAMPWRGRFVVGAKYAANKLRLFDDGRDGEAKNGNVSFADGQLALAMLNARDETHLAFAPHLNFRRGEASFARPATLDLTHRRQVSKDAQLLAAVSHRAWQAVNKDETAAWHARLGYGQAVGKSPLFGAVLGYGHAHARSAAAASFDNIPALSLALYGHLIQDEHTHWGVVLEGKAARGSGKSPSGAKSRLTVEASAYQLSFARVL